MRNGQTYASDLPVVEGPVPVWRGSSRHCWGKDVECLGVKYVYDVREKSASQKKRVDIFKLETVRQRFVILRLKCTVGDHVGIPNAVVLFFCFLPSYALCSWHSLICSNNRRVPPEIMSFSTAHSASAHHTSSGE